MVSQPIFLPNNGYKVWEDPSFIKWNKRDSHVTLRCHDSVEGDSQYSMLIATCNYYMLDDGVHVTPTGSDSVWFDTIF